MPPKRNKKTKTKKGPSLTVSAETKKALQEVETQQQRADSWMEENRESAMPPSMWPARSMGEYTTVKPKRPLILTPQTASKETIDARKFDVVYGYILESLKNMTGDKDGVSSIVNELFTKLKLDELVDMYVFLEYCKNVRYVRVGLNNSGQSLTADGIIQVRNSVEIPEEFYGPASRALADTVENILNPSRSKRTRPTNMYTVGRIDNDVIIDFGVDDYPPPPEEVIEIELPTPLERSGVYGDGPSENYLAVMEHLSNLINPPRRFTDMSEQLERVVAGLKKELGKGTGGATSQNNSMVSDYLERKQQGGNSFAPKSGSEGYGISLPTVVLDKNGTLEYTNPKGSTEYTKSFD